MRDSTSLFDHQEDTADELTREFWGEKSAWVSDERRRSSGRTMQIRPADEQRGEYHLDHTPTSMRAVREGIAAFKPKRRTRHDVTGPVQRTRQHGVVTGATPAPVDEPAHRMPRRPSAESMAHSDASIADLGAGRYDYDDHAYDLSDLDEPIPARRSAAVPVAHASAHAAADRRTERRHDDDDDLVALTPAGFGDRLGLSSVDPAVVRIGIVLLVLVLALPIALAMRGDDSSGSELPGDTVPAAPQSVVATGTEPAASPASDDAAVSSPAATPAEDTASAPAEPDASIGATQSAPAQPVTVTESADSEQATAARSAQSDEAVDATDASDASAVAVVDEPAERITPDCSLNYTAGAGDSWYRIAGAAGVSPDELLAQNLASIDTVILPGDEICLPAGSTVPSPPTTVTPTTTEAPTTTQAPTTTAAPTTTVAPSETYSPAEVQALIREIFPADQHEKALQVAWRESNYIETADNGWCCVGVFQIYWTVHQSWLDDYGIYTRDDLKNARKNITAAYALYQSSGGWGPWGG